MRSDILTARHEAAHAVIAAALDTDGDGFPTRVALHPEGGGSTFAPVPSNDHWMDTVAAGLIQETMDGARSYWDIVAGSRKDLAMLALGNEYTEPAREAVARMNQAPQAILAVALPLIGERRGRVEEMLRRHQVYVYSVANWLVVDRQLDHDQLRYVLGPIAGAEFRTPRRRWWWRHRALPGELRPTATFALTPTVRDCLQ